MISSYGEDVQSRKYGDKEFVSAFGLDEYDSEARWYYPAIMRTTTMDPLCEKYYSSSPYAWCGNNPVNLVDMDGREIINRIDSVSSPNEYNGAENLREFDDNSTIYMVAHGDDEGIYLADGTTIMTAEDFELFIQNNSELWNTTEDKSKLSIVLVSCQTGRLSRLSDPIGAQIGDFMGNKYEVDVYAPSTDIVTWDGHIRGLFSINPSTQTTKFDRQHAGNWIYFSKSRPFVLRGSTEAIKATELKERKEKACK